MDEESTTSNLRVKWMSSNEAAERLGVTTATLYRFIDEGRLPAYRMGRVIRLKESELEDFERTCRIEPGSLSHLIQE
ncbi:MAG: helix-turn-helix domain-containing protein [Acidimicrobiales bacterium]|jgi:excisionase family DNA binding protein|nr:helix-turn-helix domain-containing protein [Acidimicrobiales bacterium]